MMRLIIVDDEPMTRMFLKDILDWEELNITLTGTFSNGQTALEFIRENGADIVLTDIKMSPMSGLELTRYLYEHFPEIKVVIMSAYRDFEYAHESIRYRVFDYILKPITYESFYEVFRKLSESSGTAFREEKTQAISLSLVLSYVRSFLSAVNSDDKEQIQKKIETMYQKFGNDSASLTKLADCLCSELCSIYGQKIIYASANSIKNLNQVQEISAIKEISDELIALAIELKQSPDYATQGLPPIEQAIHYMEEHCHEQITRNDVAEHIALSPQYFSRYFHSQTNETFSNYLKQVRIRKAKYLLKNTNLKIKEISYLCGIRKERYFSMLFKQMTDLSPQEYRNSAIANDTEE